MTAPPDRPPLTAVQLASLAQAHAFMARLLKLADAGPGGVAQLRKVLRAEMKIIEGEIRGEQNRLRSAALPGLPQPPPANAP